MTATNHALTGAAIGLIVAQPAIALPAAIISHYICDALPHYAAKDAERTIKSKGFRNYLVVEAGLCFLIVLALVLTQPAHWLLAAVCAFLAAAPDFLWINRFLTIRQGKLWKPNTFSKFAARIQWFQRPIGLPIEIVWFAAMLVILTPIMLR